MEQEASQPNRNSKSKSKKSANEKLIAPELKLSPVLFLFLGFFFCLFCVIYVWFQPFTSDLFQLCLVFEES